MIALVLAATPAVAQPVRGTVVFEGTPPARAAEPRAGDPACAREVLAEDVVVTDGKLKDAVVRIKNGTLRTKVAVPPPAVLDQRGCSYVPRVLGLVAGQQLVVRNSDGTFHNVHGTVAGALVWNKPAPQGADPLTLDGSPRAGDVIEVTCDVHPWMRAYAVVQDHAAFAVTGADGRFELRDVPPGRYTVEAWHPVLGTRSAEVTVGRAGATTKLVFRRDP